MGWGFGDGLRNFILPGANTSGHWEIRRPPQRMENMTCHSCNEKAMDSFGFLSFIE